MTQPLKQEGNFRGLITEYSLYEADSGAIGINVKARVTAAWDAESQSWCDWTEYDLECEGCIYVVKKNNGGVNQRSADSLIKFAGWDGSIASVVSGEWKPTPCAFSVETDNYKDEQRFRIAFINDYDRDPGGGGNVSPERAKELQTLYGSQLRALAGNATRNATPPPGKPVPPKKRPAVAPATAPAKTIDEVNAELQDSGATDDIPF